MTSINLNLKENFDWDKYSEADEEKLVKEDSLCVYNDKELEYLDKYLPQVRNAFDEDELYEIILDCNFNHEEIEKTIKERIRYLTAKGTQYGWNVVDRNHRLKPVEMAEKLKNKEEEKNLNKNNKKNFKNENYSKRNKNYNKGNNYQEENENYNDTTVNENQYYNNYNYDQYYPENYTSNNYQNSDYAATNNYYKNNWQNNYNNYNENYNNYSNNYVKRNYKNNYKAEEDYNYTYDYNNKYENNYYDYNQNNQNYYYPNKNYNYINKYKKKIRPDTKKDKYNSNYNYKNYYNQNYEQNYSQNYIQNYNKDYKNYYNKNNYRIIIKDLDDIVPSTTVNNELNNLPPQESNENQPSETKNIIEQENESNPLSSLNKINDNNSNNIPQNQQEFKIQNPSENSENTHQEQALELEEINVNKTDIENLRSYFDRLKQYTVFSESSGVGQYNTNNNGQGIYEKFQNFTNSNLPVFQQNFHSNSDSVKEEETLTNTTYNMSKLLNNLSVNNSQILEISSNGVKSQEANNTKKIVNFSLFISGSDKKPKVEEKEVNKEIHVESNVEKNLQKNTNNLSGMSTFNNLQQQPIPQYMNYPFSNVMTATHNPNTVTPTANYYDYQNPQRFNPYPTPQVDPSQYEMYPQYEYPHYNYYQMPYRMNPMQGYHNVGNYPQFTGPTAPQEPYPTYTPGMYPQNNMNMPYPNYPNYSNYPNYYPQSNAYNTRK